MWYEFIGSAFILDKYWPKAFVILDGLRDSGKSSLLELTHRMLGYENVSHQSLQSLADDKFMRHVLYGKLANIFPDLPETDIRQIDYIKTLTGFVDTVAAEQKNVKDPLNFLNRARLIFASNKLPRVRGGLDDAILERAHIIHCKNQFINGKNARPELVNELSRPEGRSAYLLLALRGVQRLLSQGELSVSQGVANARTTWRVSTSTPVRWISEATIPGKPTDAIIKELEGYEDYRVWCTRGKYEVCSVAEFVRRVNESSAQFGMTDTTKQVGVEQYNTAGECIKVKRQHKAWGGRKLRGLLGEGEVVESDDD